MSLAGAIFIYAIGREDGPIKIGISANPWARVLDLQTACPFKIELIHARECGDRPRAMGIERTLHRTFEVERLEGEWFNINDQLAVERIDDAIEIAEFFENCP